MPNYDDELLRAARRLDRRKAGQRGRLSSAFVRRSISTTYYALFHFLLDETGLRLVGTRNDLRYRRRVFGRTLTHSGIRTALNKVRSQTVDKSVEELLRQPASPAGPVRSPPYVQEIARAFLDAEAKREDADYDLNKPLSEADARLLRSRVRRAIAGWRAANTVADKDFKHALCMLFVLKGQLRKEN